ncbi:hypothetical protein GCM10022415_29760 [Knoellia locipacati]|uniref:Restriction endonuclease n=1 Tax=Knoellia locipacati TaxID=882824 RepID=A0A512T4R9_9MICO|nr:hypothetical protein [Knoellia locipacati]GEQ15215.1 hypothetical protein KLO01_32620 [Knoellia locipacati]
MSEHRFVDGAWIDDNIDAVGTVPVEPGSREVAELQSLLSGWAEAFCAARDDVESPGLRTSSRGLLRDEAQSFLRAIKDGAVRVTDTGHFMVTCVRAKPNGGVYSLLSKSGDGVALNLEYVIQAGATAELARDHGWLTEALDFERGEFDAFGYGPDGRVLLAMEAKCRARGTDSVEKLLREWLRLSEAGAAGAPTNAGRKYAELLRLCEAGTVVVWLVAANLRWAFSATTDDARLFLRPLATFPTHGALSSGPGESGRAVLWVEPHDPALHRAGTKGARGGCSWFCAERAQWSVGVREAGDSESVFALCDPHRARVETVYG